MLPSFASQKVTVVRAPLVDAGHGRQVRDWSAAVSTLVEGCSVQPGASETDLVNRSGASIEWTVWMPAGSDVADTDKVVVDGVEYAVDGTPARWSTGVLDHVVVLLKRWEG